jgi:hypothetical protein
MTFYLYKLVPITTAVQPVAQILAFSQCHSFSAEHLILNSERLGCLTRCSNSGRAAVRA